MKLLPNVGHVVGGSINLLGRDLGPLSEKQMQHVRGNDAAMIFQDPMTSLNPTWTIGRQIAEAYQLHNDTTQHEAMVRAREVLELVGLPRPAERLNAYPYQLSGGLRQRVMIAMALVNSPKLLIADEPTTALDVTIQAQILDLIDNLRRDFEMAVILITHDLGVIAARADRVMVMYAGKIAEGSGTEELFALDAAPVHRGAVPLDSAVRPGPLAGALLHPRRPARPDDARRPVAASRPAAATRRRAARRKSRCSPRRRSRLAAGRRHRAHRDPGSAPRDPRRRARLRLLLSGRHRVLQRGSRRRRRRSSSAWSTPTRESTWRSPSRWSSARRGAKR